jgi:hypothetical protein
MKRKLLINISVDFDIVHQLLIAYTAVVGYWRKIGVQQRFRDLQKLG